MLPNAVVESALRSIFILFWRTCIVAAHSMFESHFSGMKFFRCSFSEQRTVFHQVSRLTLRTCEVFDYRAFYKSPWLSKRISAREWNINFQNFGIARIIFSLVRKKKEVSTGTFMSLIAYHMANEVSCRLTVLVGSMRWVWGVSFKFPLHKSLDNKLFCLWCCNRISLLKA